MSQSRHSHGEIRISSVEEARRLARSYSGVITIEDPGFAQGLRLDSLHDPPQLILQFGDLSEDIPSVGAARAKQLSQALEFERAIRPKPLLIHCHAGISRSAAIALTILADRSGAGREAEALQALRQLRPAARPNMLLVSLADDLLGRDGALKAVVSEWALSEGWLVAGALPDQEHLSLVATQGHESKSMEHRIPEGWIAARVRLEIPASPETLFAFIADAKNDMQWIDQLADSRQLGDGPIGLGIQFAQVAVGPLGRAAVVWEICEFRPSIRIAVRSVRGDYRFIGSYDLAPTARGTLLTKFGAFERRGMLRAVPRAMGSAMMRDRFQKWLVTLARLASSWPA